MPQFKSLGLLPLLCLSSLLDKIGCCFLLPTQFHKISDSFSLLGVHVSKRKHLIFYQTEQGNPAFLFQQGKPRKKSIFCSTQNFYMHTDTYILLDFVLLPKQ